VATIERFEDIEAWTHAREVTRLIYEISSKGTFAKDFALRDQIRRAAISILSNIAEGFERSGNREFFNFLAIAKGSCGEVRSQLYIAFDQGYLGGSEFDELLMKLSETSRVIAGFMRYLRKTDLRGDKFKQLEP
jgi:four helix bundle protein